MAYCIGAMLTGDIGPDGYERVVNGIVRPPRADYSEVPVLGAAQCFTDPQTILALTQHLCSRRCSESRN